jgi:hypothetical protein
MIGLGRGMAGRRIGAVLAVLVVVAGCRAPVRRPPIAREPTIADRLAQYGPVARARLAPYFAAARVPYPPERFVLVGFKRERELDLLAAGPGRPLAFIRSYPIWGASGVLGPKLREGDGQVPEGIYGIEYLNPNSVAHLSLALTYPNDYDRARAEEDGRDDLGGNIMIHGGSGYQRAVVVVSPVDFRRTVLPADYQPSTGWVEDLYRSIWAELAILPLPPTAASSAAAVDVPATR